MKQIIISLALSITVLSCTNAQECEQGINLKPMYGGVKKCKEQIDADNDFLKEVDSQFNDRKLASQKYAEYGWSYFYENNLETAMKRFNQAWMLDSMNYQTYWGFGNIIGTNKQYKESEQYFKKAVELEKNNAALWDAYATTSLQLFFVEKNDKYLAEGISHLKKAIAIDNTNSHSLTQLVIAYSYYTQQDSTRKYMNILDKRDKTLIPDEVRQRAK